MKAIVLAAGMGKRLQEASGGLPKSMITIGEKSIIHNQIQSCLEAGISSFIFVVGFKKDQLKQHILEVLQPEQTVFVENPIFDKTNTLYSLYLTMEHWDDDFIYFNADVLFKKDLLKKISGKSDNSQLLVETKRCGEEEVKVILNEKNHITEIGKKLDVSLCAGEFIGVGKFLQEVFSSFKKHLKQGVKDGQENNFFEYAVNFVAKECLLEAVPTDDVPCIEIDFPEDLEKAIKLFS
jgi:choline kinase